MTCPRRLLGIAHFALAALVATGVWAQTSTDGGVTVNVTDPSGSSVPDAQLSIRHLETNDTHRASTQAAGTFSFPNLPFGVYELTITKNGFDTQVFPSVVVQTARVTTVNATLKVGGTTQTVTVADSASPLVETDSSVLSTTIDTRQVVNLPLLNRSVMSLAFLVPGWASTGVASSSGTWNNMPGGAVVGADFDGTPGISNRFRSGGFNYGTTAVQPRIEDVAEMTIQTAQLDLSGTGTSAMRISIVTRRGANAFHGRLFEDFRNTVLQANSWSNNARGLPRGILNLNDFGGNIGGPIIKNKLFFFFTYAESIQPRSSTATSPVLSPGAQQGLFSYKDSTGAIKTVDVLQIAGNAGYRSTVLPNIASQLQQINGSLSKGTVTPTSDPNVSTLNFLYSDQIKNYFPAVRVDYHATENVRLNLSYSQTKNDDHNRYNPNFPGVDTIDQASSKGNARIAGFGVDWTVRPTLINQFHAGYMYQYSTFSPENLGIDLSSVYRQNWGYPTNGSLYGNVYPRTAISSFYPLLSANDSLTWQKGSHSMVFGGSWYREQDHYWNGVGGEPTYNFGIDGADPLSGVFGASVLGSAGTTPLNNAKALYATLTGRVSAVNIQVGRPLDPATKQYKPYGAYNLNEVVGAGGFWAQDRWRIRRNLVLNYGLRWDFVGDDHDVDGGYSTLPSLGDLWGPTPVGSIFKPGTLGGVQNPQFKAQVHAYNSSKMNPSPAVALAWSPEATNGLLGRMIGKDKTVIRAGYSLRHYTEGGQNIWAFASNAGQFFFQQGGLNPSTSPSTGFFQPGSLTFGDPLPPYLLTPTTYSPVVPAANLTFSGNQFFGLNPNIQQPYLQQWNIGIQRQAGSNSAFEMRYVGNLALHQWLSYNINEVNIFENGFLAEFKNAQTNLQINQANGKGSTFANNGFAGQSALPIFSAAFTGQAASAGFANGTFITNLQTGAAGSLARSLANSATFFCNMVGTASFAPCAARNINAPGAGYPINFWQVNPFDSGQIVNYLDASGMSNYHGLQLEFRQRPTHGAQFNVNYTWAHSLGIATQNGIQGQGNNIYYTARNFRLNYAPGLFDIRQVVHASGTYDLPFGKGRPWLNQNQLLNYAVGGWTLGTIISLQTGSPQVFGNGFNTVSNIDSGIVFNNSTAGDLQKSVGVFKSGSPWVTLFDPKYIGSNGAANAAYITPASTPGVFGYRPYIYGPAWYNIDLSLNKSIPIRERLRMTLQAQFLNATNHPTFSFSGANATPAASIQSLSFGQVTTGPSTARVIELRLNIEF